MKIQNKKGFSNHKKKLFLFLMILLLVAAGGGVYTKIAHLWPFDYESMPSNNVPRLPVTQQSNDKSSNVQTDANNSTSPTPTKTEGKTPIQYEDEKLDDAPAYNNEQFRIPEDSR